MSKDELTLKLLNQQEKLNKENADLKSEVESLKAELSVKKTQVIDPLKKEKLEKMEKALQETSDLVQSHAIKLKAKKAYSSADGYVEHHTANKRLTGDQIALIHKQAKSVFDDPVKDEYEEKFWDGLKNFGRNSKKLADFQNYAYDLKTENKISADESFIKKTLNTIVGEDGGYLLAPPSFEMKIQELVYETSPLRKVATVMPVSTSQKRTITENSLAGAYWGSSEQPVRNTDTPKFNEVTIGIDTLNANARVTFDEIEDAAFPVEMRLKNSIAKQFSLMENAAFIKGNGTDRPYGLNHYAANAEASPSNVENLQPNLVSVTNANFDDMDSGTLDALLDLEAKIKSDYKPNAVYLINRTVKNLIRKSKDSNNQYLYSDMGGWGGFQGVPKIMDGLNGRINGYPILECDDLDDNGTGNKYPVYFGDFSFYKIYDRIGMMTILDKYTVKGSLVVYCRKRLGAGLTLAEGIAVLRTT